MPHPGSYPIAIESLQFGIAEVGGDVRLNFPVDEQIVSAQKDFGHDVGFVAEVFHGGFCAQVIHFPHAAGIAPFDITDYPGMGNNRIDYKLNLRILCKGFWINNGQKSIMQNCAFKLGIHYTSAG